MCEFGIPALMYVHQTLDLGLDFPYEVGPVFGTRGYLALPRAGHILEVYSDASHSPQGNQVAVRTNLQ